MSDKMRESRDSWEALYRAAEDHVRRLSAEVEEARAEGRRQGIEEAAQVVSQYRNDPYFMGALSLADVEERIRALAPPPVTQPAPTTCECGHDAGSHDYCVGYCRARRPSGSCGCKHFRKDEPSNAAPTKEHTMNDAKTQFSNTLATLTQGLPLEEQQRIMGELVAAYDLVAQETLRPGITSPITYSEPAP